MEVDLSAASAALDAAGARQAKIDEQIALVQLKLDKLKEEKLNKGRGRPNANHASKKKSLKAKDPKKD